MSDRRNRHVVLKERATGLPKASLFELRESECPAPGPGQVLLHTLYVSADPGMKGWIGTARNYASVETGATMRSYGVGEVVESNHPDVAVGSFAFARTGWQEYAITGPEDEDFRPVDPADGPISTALGVLGTNGLTAYFGLLDAGRPKSGDTVVVSTAAGAVGSAVGQIAKIKGCRTVGIAGGAEKAALCRDEFGFDAVIDYKATKDLGAAIDAACPDGVDVYYDNVGGATFDMMLAKMRTHGRVVVCGTAATESWVPQPSGLRPERNILVGRLSVQGILVFDFVDRFPQALADLRGWVKEGRLRYREDIMEGLENAPAALEGLYQGRNMGRQLVRVRPDPTR